MGISSRSGSSGADLDPFEVRAAGAIVRGVRGGQGQLALLLHGTTGSWRNFRRWLPALLPRRHVIIPDLPGFGASPVPAARPSLAAWAGILGSLTQQLETPPRTLIGLGFGAALALAYLRESEREADPVMKLVLHTPPFAPETIRASFQWALRILGAPLLSPLVENVLTQRRVQDWYLRRFVIGRDSEDQDAALLREDLARTSFPVLRDLLLDLSRTDFRPLLRTISASTLVIVGENDPFVRVDRVRDLATLMPGARVFVQRGLAHGWTAEAVEEHHRLLAEFLDEEGWGLAHLSSSGR